MFASAFEIVICFLFVFLIASILFKEKNKIQNNTTKNTPVFCDISVRKNLGTDGYCASLKWMDSISKNIYEIRGYGKSPIEATQDAWEQFKKDPEENSLSGFKYLT